MNEKFESVKHMNKQFKKREYRNKQFAENINFLTEQHGITKKQIENDLGIGQGALSKYCNEGAEQRPNIELFMNLADIFKVTIDQLINDNLKDIKEINRENNERIDIRFCKKLTDETNKNLIEWKAINFEQKKQTILSNGIYNAKPKVNHNSEKLLLWVCFGFG